MSHEFSKYPIRALDEVPVVQMVIKLRTDGLSKMCSTHEVGEKLIFNSALKSSRAEIAVSEIRGVIDK